MGKGYNVLPQCLTRAEKSDFHPYVEWSSLAPPPNAETNEIFRPFLPRQVQHPFSPNMNIQQTVVDTIVIEAYLFKGS